MTIIYSLWYRHPDRNDVTLVVEIGGYSTVANAENAIPLLRDQPGFREHGIYGFAIEARRIDVTRTAEGDVGDEGTLTGTTYYSLEHDRTDDRGYDHETVIGLYSTEQRAKNAIALVRNQSDFVGHPDGFEIWPHALDFTSWREGFFTAYLGEE